MIRTRKVDDAPKSKGSENETGDEQNRYAPVMESSPPQLDDFSRDIEHILWMKQHAEERGIDPETLLEERTAYKDGRATRLPLGPDVEPPPADPTHIDPERKRMLRAREEAKQAAGRYTLEEAADRVATAAGERLDIVLGKLIDAVQAGALTTYEPGRNARMEYGAGWGRSSYVRTFYEEVYWNDLNSWLQGCEHRIQFRFPAPDSCAEDGADRKGPQRRDILWAAIEKAMAQAGGASTFDAVFPLLRELALQGEPPFTGMFEDDGAFVYTDEQNRRATLTLHALRQRLSRRK